VDGEAGQIVNIVTMRIPPLETDRMRIRPFDMEDLDAIHAILERCFPPETTIASTNVGSLEQRREWLQWTVLNYQQLARLHQPPYGERAIVLKQENRLIGAVGFVPCLDRFGQLPSLRFGDTPVGLSSTEFGLFWAVDPSFQRQGYATEAAAAMIVFAFRELRLHRIIATTSHDNAASMRVMTKVGMRLEKNPFPDPPWLQVVGVLENNTDR
jgi:RimJ/RimL family protein N-acetyltransferase